MPLRKQWILLPLLLGGSLLFTSRTFFEIYREAAFQTTSHDDYASLLLKLDGHPTGAPIPAAFQYRLLSVIPALPLVHLPFLYRFPKLPANVDPDWLRATQALCLLSWLMMTGASLLCALLARRHFHASLPGSVATGLLSWILWIFVSRSGVDPIALFTVALLLLALPHWKAFAALVLLSAGVNEKIPLIFFTLLFGRQATRRGREARFQLGASFLALLLHLAARLALDLPALPQNTLDPARFPDRLLATGQATLSPKGVVLNLLPILVLLALYGLSLRSRRRAAQPIPFHTADLLPLPTLIFLAALFDVRFNLGRIAMYTLPLYLPAVALLFASPPPRPGPPLSTSG
ncbi:MAG: hypothetical protein ACE5H3_06385 [Planctomycetota bacterium]